MSSLERILKLVKKYNNHFDRVLNKVKVVAAENGKCVAELKVDVDHKNLMGTLHGAFSAALVDNMSSLGLMTLTGDKGHVSVSMVLTYLKAANIGDDIVVEANTLKIEKSLAFLLVNIKNKQTGELLVKGTHTKYIINHEITPD